MTYNESVSYVENAAVFGAAKNGLENIRELLRRLGNPQDSFRSIHVAGTNGKGSVCAFVDSILRKQGLKVGLYTSPYLEKFTERIRIDGKEIEEDVFAAICTDVRAAAEGMVRDGLVHPTFFELVTACCFIAFRDASVDVAVVEVGLGGRLDATNVIRPVLSVITSIGLDHTKVLGNTVEEIAREKAGIIKPGTPVVIYPQPHNEAYYELLNRAREVDAPVYAVRDASLLLEESSLEGQTFSMQYQGMNLGSLRIGLIGDHQVLNAATAVLASILYSQITDLDMGLSVIRSGLSETKWAGRMEILSREPLIMIDGAHNPQGASQLRQMLDRLTPNHSAVMLFAACKTKDVDQVARILAPAAAHIVVTQPPIYKALPAEEAGDAFRAHNADPQIVEDFGDAYRTALAAAKGYRVPLIVTGSLYLVGAVRKLLAEN